MYVVHCTAKLLKYLNDKTNIMNKAMAVCVYFSLHIVFISIMPVGLKYDNQTYNKKYSSYEMAKVHEANIQQQR